MFFLDKLKDGAFLKASLTPYDKVKFIIRSCLMICCVIWMTLPYKIHAQITTSSDPFSLPSVEIRLKEIEKIIPKRSIIPIEKIEPLVPHHPKENIHGGSAKHKKKPKLSPHPYPKTPPSGQEETLIKPPKAKALPTEPVKEPLPIITPATELKKKQEAAPAMPKVLPSPKLEKTHEKIVPPVEQAVPLITPTPTTKEKKIVPLTPQVVTPIAPQKNTPFAPQEEVPNFKAPEQNRPILPTFSNPTIEPLPAPKKEIKEIPIAPAPTSLPQVMLPQDNNFGPPPSLPLEKEKGPTIPALPIDLSPPNSVPKLEKKQDKPVTSTDLNNKNEALITPAKPVPPTSPVVITPTIPAPTTNALPSELPNSTELPLDTPLPDEPSFTPPPILEEDKKGPWFWPFNKKSQESPKQLTTPPSTNALPEPRSPSQNLTITPEISEDTSPVIAPTPPSPPALPPLPSPESFRQTYDDKGYQLHNPIAAKKETASKTERVRKMEMSSLPPVSTVKNTQESGDIGPKDTTQDKLSTSEFKALPLPPSVIEERNQDQLAQKKIIDDDGKKHFMMSALTVSDNANSLASSSHEVTLATIIFQPGDTALPSDPKIKESLSNIAKNYKNTKKGHLSIISYAGNNSAQMDSARRISLHRAIAVRKELIDNGVESIYINVRAMGGTKLDNSFDNQDIIIIKEGS